MPVRRHVPGRLRPADPGPHDVLPVPQAPVRAGRAGGGPVLPGSAGVRAARGWAACPWWPATGSRSPRTPRQEASRTEAGLRKLAGQVIAAAPGRPPSEEDAEQGRAARRGPAAGRGHGTAATGSAVAGRAGAGVPGRPCKQSGRPPRPPPASWGRPTWRRWRPAPREMAGPRLRWRMAAAAGPAGDRPSPPRQTTLADWQARHAAGQRLSRPPARPGTGKKARKARARLEALQAQAAAEAGQAPDADKDPGERSREGAAAQRHRPGLPAAAGARRRVHPGL